MLKRTWVAIAAAAVGIGGVAVQCAGRPAVGFVAPRIVAQVPDPGARLQDVHGETWYVTGDVRAGKAHTLGIVVTNPGTVSVTLRNVGFNWDAHYLYDFAPSLVGSTDPPYALEGVARKSVRLGPGEERLFVLPSVYKCTVQESMGSGSFAAMSEVHADVRFRSTNRSVRMRLPIPDGVTPTMCEP